MHLNAYAHRNSRKGKSEIENRMGGMSMRMLTEILERENLQSKMEWVAYGLVLV